MKFAITREALLQPLQQVIGVVERRQTLPILANVMLEVNSGLLAVTATDLEVELIGKIALEQPHEEGVTTVPARKLLDICRSLPDGASIEIETAEGRLHLRAGRSRYRLATLAAEEFPNVDEGQAPALAAFAVAQSILKRLIEKTSFAMAQQDVRFYLCGMLLEISGGAGQLRGVATDGHRLAMYTVENIESVTAGLLSNRVQAIIPRKGTLEIARLLKESEEPVRVQLTQHHLRIESSDVVIISKLVDGKFPDYEKVIPRGGDKVLLGERLALRDAFNRAAILSNEKYRGVRMQLDRDTLRLIASNPEQEQAEEELSVHYQGPQMEIGFNVGYLTDALAALDQNEARFTFSSAESSVLIDVPNDASGCYVVMPMKL